MNKAKEIILLAVLIAIAAIPRFSGLGRFTSIDEPFWLRAGGNFYYAISHHQFEYTLYDYHPAVTTMWIVTAGMLTYFPDYRTLANGYLKPPKFYAFFTDHSKSMLQLIIVSRAYQTILIIVLLLVLYLLLRVLFNSWKAFLATGLLSSAPYFLGHSRLLNHEALFSLFLLISLLSLLSYFHLRRRMLFLLLSGIAAGLTQLTLSTGMVLFPVAALLVIVAAWRSAKRIRAALWIAAKTFGMWLLAAVVTYVLLWPGIWVAPAEMLSYVYGNAYSYIFQGARLSAAAGVPAPHLTVVSVAGGLSKYLQGLEWRVTPVTWIGFALAMWVAVRSARKGPTEPYASVIASGVLLGCLIFLVFSVVPGRQAPHYIIATYACIEVVSGLGYAYTIQSLISRSRRLAAWLVPGCSAVLLLAQLGSSLAFYPYYITYYDPLVKALGPKLQNPILNDTGYGVGLDQAAAYLAQKPGASQMTVMSANGDGSFSYYFPGMTIPMNYLRLSDRLVMQAIVKCQYVVVDYYNQRRLRMLSDLKGVRPEKTIVVDGIDFLRIYRAADILAKSQRP